MKTNNLMIDVEKALKVIDNFSENRNVKNVLIYDSTTNNAPKISFCVPTYKRCSTLEETLDSIINQKGLDSYEIVIGDNNPEREDETETYFKQHSYKELKYFKYSNVLTAYGNYNRLIENSKGELVIFVHDDDILFENFYQEVRKVFDQTNADFLYSNRIAWYQFKNEPKPQMPIGDNRNSFYRLGMSDFFTGNPCPPTGFVCKREKFIESGGFSLIPGPSGDYYFALKVALNYNTFFYTNPIWIYRWALNATSRVDVLVRLFKSDIPLKKWFANKCFIYRLLLPLELLSYSKMYFNIYQRNNTSDNIDEISKYIRTSFSKIDDLKIRVYAKLWRQFLSTKHFVYSHKLNK